jgi:ferredoxin
MPKFTVVLDREKCIGAAACVAAAPKLWKLGKDDKTNLIDGAKNEDNTVQTCEIDEKDLSAHLDAAQSCPVNAIHIKKENGEKLI